MVCRDILIWYKFTGQGNSKDYLEAFSHSLEFWTRTVLFLLYLGSIGLIFGEKLSKPLSSCWQSLTSAVVLRALEDLPILCAGLARKKVDEAAADYVLQT